MQGAKRVLGFMFLTLFGVVLGLLVLDRLPTRHFDWTDYLTWGICSVLIYMGFSFRSWTAACSARKRLCKVRG